MAEKPGYSDSDLGMSRKITRRDFLNGVALTVGASLISSNWLQASGKTLLQDNPDYYPPALTGLRGSADGSFEVAHDLRDGTFWKSAATPVDTGEEYDLVVVGAGISGLSAAYFYRRQAGDRARILLLDNHDDFGGHARRNEFRADGRLILGFGGTWAIDSPAPYSRVAAGLVKDLGIDINQWSSVHDRSLYASLGLQSGVFFDHKTFGKNQLLPFFSEYDSELPLRAAAAPVWRLFSEKAPIHPVAKKDIRRLYTESVDYMPGLTSKQKKEKLARISYADFLLNIAKVHTDVVKFFRARAHGLYGVGIEAIPAQDAWGIGFPGFNGLKLDRSFGKGMNRDAMRMPGGGEDYFFHFPDGNATLARLLVRRLIPSAIPGKNVGDIVPAKCDYTRLDRKESTVRLRLNSTVVRVRHAQPSNSNRVEVTYSYGKRLRTVRARRCILACWHSVIPYICEELPKQQKEDLAYEVKVPLLYTNVILSNWKCFQKAGVSEIYCPGSFHSAVNLDMPVSIGSYTCSRSPDEPILVHMMRTPCSPGLPARSQHRAGRFEMLTATFQTYELEIRRQLTDMFAPYGFNPANDIRAITVNRWAHGYAYQYNSLFDPFWLEGSETPCERARKPFGRIAIANADAGAYSYTDCAIDQAHRAVQEILSVKE